MMQQLPQRVPLASFKSPNGTEVMVYIRKEWLGLVNALIEGVSGTTEGATADFDLSPLPQQSQGKGTALEFGNEPGDAATAARVHSLLQRVSSLESDALVQQLRAEVAALRKQVEALQEA